MRIRIRRPRQGDDLEDLARFQIDLLHQVIAGDQDPERAVVPIESMRAVAAGGAQSQHSKVLRIDFGHRLDAQRRDPQGLRLGHKRDAVHAAAPDQLMNLDGLPCLQIRLNHCTKRLVRGTRRAPAAHAAVGAQPQVTGPDGNPARVVRLGLHLVQHLTVLPADLEHALRHLIADPQTVRCGFECVRVNVRRLEQPFDLRLTRRHWWDFGRRVPLLRRCELCRRHPGDHRRRRRPDELSSSDYHESPLFAQLEHV